MEVVPSSNYVFPSTRVDDMVLYTSSSNQRVFMGIGSNVPPMFVMTSNSIGISKSNPAFSLDVGGIVNASSLYVNGTPYIGSQWSNVGSNVFLLQSNVGIGVSNPAATFHVFGNSTVQGNMNIRGLQVSKRDATLTGLGSGLAGALGLSNDSFGNIVIATTSNNATAHVKFTAGSAEVARINGVGAMALGGCNLGYMLSLNGPSDSFSSGPHIAAYMNGNADPITTLQSINQDNVSLSFGAHFNGAWTASTSANAYQIYKLNGQLRFNYAANTTPGTTFTPLTAMVVNSNGYIGIGPNFINTTHFLHVHAPTNDNGIMLSGSSNGNVSPVLKLADWNNVVYGRIGIAGSATNIVASSAINDLVIRAENKNIWLAPNGSASNVAAVYTPQGFLGIGLSNPLYPLHITTQNSNVSIFAAFDVVAFSDERLKTDLKPISHALDKVNKLTGYTYSRKDSSFKERFAGVIAQDVTQVLPEVVHKNEDGILSVAYGNLTALLIEAIKELTEKNKRLEEAYLQLYA